MNIFGSIKEKIAQYIDVYIKLLKLNLVEKSSVILSYFIFSCIGLFFVFCFFIMLTLGLVETFVESGISKMGAYFLTSGIYVLLLLLLFVVRRGVTSSLTNVFISMFTDTKDDVQK
jgi:cellulose synthase/poly-beta-1,6-N-acetylglucosamine synthase-like glycosyltransferase